MKNETYPQIYRFNQTNYKILKNKVNSVVNTFAMLNTNVSLPTKLGNIQEWLMNVKGTFVELEKETLANEQPIWSQLNAQPQKLVYQEF